MNSFTKRALLNRIANRKNRKQNGFTLVEPLIVVVILGILSGVALPNFLAQRNRAVVGAANASSSALVTACEIAITNDEDATADADVIRLAAALPDNAAAVPTENITADTCTVDITGTFTATDGAFTAFGEKTPAVAGEPGV